MRPVGDRPALDVQPLRSKPVGSGHRVLLVGPLLGRDTELIAGLRRLGHRTRVEYSIQDALDAFASQSFELVLADTHIGRAEGIELVPALAEIPGIERLPVVLVDERSRESVREEARRVGAAGYLAHPVDASRISAGLDRLLLGRGRRRFARLGQRLDVSRDGSDPGFTIAIARLGFSRPHLARAEQGRRRTAGRSGSPSSARRSGWTPRPSIASRRPAPKTRPPASGSARSRTATSRSGSTT